MNIPPLLSSRLRLASAALLALWTLAPAPTVDAADAGAPRTTPPKVVLKLDDLAGMHANWQKVVESVNRRGIKASFGIICNSLEKPKPEYVQWLKDTQAGGKIEFWCHGYDHKTWTEGDLTMWEFYGPSLEQQKQHLQRCQELAKQVLGKPFVSFGAPFNQTDEKFAEVMRDDHDFKAWMYGNDKFPMGKNVLIRYGDVNIENPIFRPNTALIAAGMAKHTAAPYFVIQGHPPSWDAARLAEFEKMLDYLTEQKAVFVTPAELAASLPPPGPAGALPPPSKAVKAAPAVAMPGPSLAAGVPAGENIVNNGDFAKGMDSWRLDKMQDTKAEESVVDVEGGKKALHIKVPEAAEKRYFVQFVNKTPFPVEEGKTYTLSFRARTDNPAAKIVVIVGGTGGEIAKPDNIALKTDWETYSYTLAPKQAGPARLTVSGLAAQAAGYWFTDLSVKQNK